MGKLEPKSLVSGDEAPNHDCTGPVQNIGIMGAILTERTTNIKILDTTPTSGHWYCLDTGEARHVVPNKSKPGTYRPTTIRDARQNPSIAPSVTSILSVIAKPQLTDWRVNQAILAALTLPRERGEIDDDFAVRVVEDSKRQARDAAERGSFLHGVAEYYLTYQKVECDPEMRALFQPIKEWIDENVTEVYFAEKILVNKEFRYAGTCDLYCKIKQLGDAVVDFKGQRYREDKGLFAPLFHDEWPLQLVAYRKCLEAPEVHLVSLPFCYDQPAPLVHKVWPMEEQENYWEAFCAAHKLWRYIKKW